MPKRYTFKIRRQVDVIVDAPEGLTEAKVKALVKARAEGLLGHESPDVSRARPSFEVSIATAKRAGPWRVTDDRQGITQEEVLWIEGGD